MPARVLVAEDDVKQAKLIRLYLEREGYDVHVVGDGGSAIALARANDPDVVVLDVMMPGVDGLEVCRTLRAESDLPILVLTARTTEEDVLRGLDLGADDYLTKPYSPRELAARVRALLRRSGRARPDVRTVGDLQIDAARFEVRAGEQVVTLTAREFAILHVLAAEPGRVFTRAQIIDRAFDVAADVLERTVDAHVANLRRKLAPAATRVETVFGRGYRLVPS